MIKLTNLLKEITEAKQVGNLYHFTHLRHLYNILDNGLQFQKDNIGDHLKKYSISTTRSSDFSGNDIYDFTKRASRIVLDGNKISQKYKIAPVNADNIWNLKGMKGDRYTKSKDHNLFEERIYSDTPGYLSTDYILRIDINDKTEGWKDNEHLYQEILDKANMKKIPINMVKNY